eukprot:g11325.t1
MNFEWTAAATTATADELLRTLLAADLRDACVGSLPENLDRQHNLRVEGQHFLQILQLVDIANPIQHDDPPALLPGAGLCADRPGRHR